MVPGVVGAQQEYVSFMPLLGGRPGRRFEPVAVYVESKGLPEFLATRICCEGVEQEPAAAYGFLHEESECSRAVPDAAMVSSDEELAQVDSAGAFAVGIRWAKQGITDGR